MKAASDGLNKRLFEARTQRGLTMDELADKAKLNQTTVSRLERGRNYPSTLTVEKLAKALHVDPCWLAWGTGENPDWLLRDSQKEKVAT